ncbi:MAG: VWA domain-containing protein [Chloroflexota bacterium]
MPLYTYLLLDTSASMSGAPLEALKQALHLLCGTFITRSKQAVQMGVITYESTAKEIAPLADVQEFEIPKLEAAGSSGLGGACRLLSAVMPAQQPMLVYLFTDGDPTDDWESAIAALKPRVQQIIGVVCGPTASSTILDPLLDQVFSVRELTPDLLFETFRQYT